jgi:hypothetical protein
LLVKINNIHNNDKVRVTKLDIDDYGSVIPVEELELKLPPHNDSIVEILRNSQYVVLFVQGNIEENGSTIILAQTMTLDELNKEKQKTIEVAEDKKEH